MQFRGEPIGSAATAAFITIGSLEVVSGVLGNVLLLSVLFTSRLLGQANCHNLFIVSLALADLVTLGYWMPFFVLDLILGYNPAVNQTHCQANAFIVCLGAVASTLSLVSISLNRYLHVCHSRLYRRVFNRNNTIACCLLLWLVGVAVTVPPFVDHESFGSYYYKNQTHTCTFTPDTYPTVMSAVLMVGSTLFIVYFNLVIFRLWRRAKLNLRTSHLTARRQICCPCGPRDSVSSQDRGTSGAGNCNETELDTESNAPTAVDMADSETNSPTASHAADVPVSRSSTADTETRRLEQGDEQGRGCSQPSSSPTVTHTDLALTSLAAGTQTCSHQDPHVDNRRCQDTEQVGETDPQEENAHSQSCPKKATPTGARKRGTCKSQTLRQQVARRRRKQQSREQALVRSLAVISLLMVFCFLPFGLARVYEKSHPLSAEVDISLVLLLFFNNSVNWAVYGIMNRHFRREYVKLMRRIVTTCCRCIFKGPVLLVSGKG